MKRLVLFSFLLLFPAAIPLGADTLPAVPTDHIRFGRVSSAGYGNAIVERASFGVPEGGYIMIVDKIMKPLGSGRYRTFWRARLLHKWKQICEQRYNDPLITGLSLGTGIRVLHYRVDVLDPKTRRPIDNKPDHCVVGLLVFQRPKALNKYRISVLVPQYDRQGFAQGRLCEQFEVSPDMGEGFDRMVLDSGDGLPATWTFQGGVQQVRGAPEVFPRLQETPPDNMLYSLCQTRLEAEARKSGLSKARLYRVHRELAWLYRRQSQPDTSGNPDVFGRKADHQEKEASRLQPRFPLRKVAHSRLKLHPFLFFRQVEKRPETDGENGFRTFRMGSTGWETSQSGPVVDWPQVERKLDRPMANGRDLVFSRLSPSGYYDVELENPREEEDGRPAFPALVVVEEGIGKAAEISIPDTGTAVEAGWDNRKDLYYFTVTRGESQSCDLWRFAPARMELREIGSTNRNFHVSPEGKWIVWGNGGQRDSHPFLDRLNVFNTEKGISYQLTVGFEPKYFIGWE